METQKNKKAIIRLQLTVRSGNRSEDTQPEEYPSENVEVKLYENILLVKPGSKTFGGWLYCAYVKEISETKVSLEISELSSRRGYVALDNFDLGLNEVKKWGAPVLGPSIVWTLELLSIN